MKISPVDLTGAQPTQPEDVARASRLTAYALAGLEKCWLPEHGRWSHIHHLDGRATPNESRPHSDVFYTLNVLLGLSRARSRLPYADTAEVFTRNARELTRLPVRDYAFGMALWASAELGVAPPEETALAIRTLLSDEAAWRRFHAQDLGLLLTGVAAQVRAGDTQWRPFAAPLFHYLQQRFQGGSALFCDTPAGLRRRFASFATQIYLALACYHYGELTGESAATDMASACVAKLIALQGPRGEWPWFYDAVSGRVLDFYEVYSVHQYGMAPALLEWAERKGVPGAREALVLGFDWALGENQLGRCMLQPGGLSIRSQIRKGERDSKAPRMARAIANALLGRHGGLIAPAQVELRLECRSYELGWLLWSFGARADLPELTGHAAFAA
ncbi:hypothetical protein SAMN06265338_101921 [Rhodoblastus acidophilus]|uniref:Uncharacterized protein n=1 Tax=Rhodoblastus acidophilus TaxID=1074 RepID=A0A212QNJ1_RHOAC|nr:hypothetical protein [Rhodoblastus acidophilus]SNB60798.1 hypothetical protein SAMN06265338_101921 [Rhodoblastus acidophilus]